MQVEYPSVYPYLDYQAFNDYAYVYFDEARGYNDDSLTRNFIIERDDDGFIKRLNIRGIDKHDMLTISVYDLAALLRAFIYITDEDEDDAVPDYIPGAAPDAGAE